MLFAKPMPNEVSDDYVVFSVSIVYLVLYMQTCSI